MCGLADIINKSDNIILEYVKKITTTPSFVNSKKTLFKIIVPRNTHVYEFVFLIVNLQTSNEKSQNINH